MKETESTFNLMEEDAEYSEMGYSEKNFDDMFEKPLTAVEKRYLLYAERGDCATVKKLLLEHASDENLDKNCVDPLNRSALVMAIENENIELIKLLLEHEIRVEDALLHAIKEEYVEAVELLLGWEEEHHAEGEPYSWEKLDRSTSLFTSDITPLILAAHKNNYEIVKILLDRGASLPMPHDAKCGCDECVKSSSTDSLRHSQARINAYKALISPSLIALSSKDPILTAFQLSWELRRLSHIETEFRSLYKEMRTKVQDFAANLLDHTRTSTELETMLNFNHQGGDWSPGDRATLDRLKLAIKYKQKLFVAHPNVQQLLGAIWYDGLPGFKRKGLLEQAVQVAQMGIMFPVYCTVYMIAPNSKTGQFMKKPFVRFICQSASYTFFLALLGCASQRIELLVMEWFGNDYVRGLVEERKKKERGSTPGFAECGVVLYVISLIWAEIRALWSDGLMEYVQDLWNIVDFVTNSFYLMWISTRVASWIIVAREAEEGHDPWYPREKWEAFEPMLISEGAFAAGMIFSFLKLVHIFSINPHLGPLQISLSRMIIDIVKFFFIYTLVLFAFGCGLNQLLWYYAELEKNKCYHLPGGLPDFENNDKACSIWRRYANLFETSQSLFWASFGLVDLVSFELTGIKGFTRFWALLMFGSYSVINIIVLLNMLIAMMSNSYQIISERADVEWKFARSKLWMSYFEDGSTLPPPFNIFPTVKNFCSCRELKPHTESFKDRSRRRTQQRHEQVMHLLIRRYITAEQRMRCEFGITEDDVTEIRQDISTLRYEIIDMFNINGMKTPKLSSEDISKLAGKKGKVMERQILKDFHIGLVEGIVNQFATSKSANDIFGKLARVISRKSSKKKDWNAMVRKNTFKQNPIGSSQESVKRRRQNLHQYILNNSNSGERIDQQKLLEMNDKLAEIPETARVAYIKFMTKKIQTGENKEDRVEEKDDHEASTSELAASSMNDRKTTCTTKSSGEGNENEVFAKSEVIACDDSSERSPKSHASHFNDGSTRKRELMSGQIYDEGRAFRDEKVQLPLEATAPQEPARKREPTFKGAWL